MKLRIRGNSIRIRLTQSEVEELKNQKTIREEVELPDGHSLIYELKETYRFFASFTGNNLCIEIPLAQANDWYETEDLSIDHFIENPQGKKLRLLIEKDLQCLTDRPHEDESDAFPNPNKNC